MNDLNIFSYPEALFGNDARNKMLEGVELLAKAVTSTLGPRGQNVIIERKGKDPILTKDGVTVAKSVNLRDPYMQMGCQMVREVAQRTNDVAGDGTTTATTLAHAIFKGGMKLLVANHSAQEIKRGIDIAAAAVVAELRKTAIKVEDDEMITSVGTISANGEKSIGELLTEAMRRVGHDGVITVEDAKGLKTSLDVVDGARFDRGYFSSYFITDSEKMVCELIDPLILISNMRFTTSSELIPLLEVINTKRRSLLIIADEVEGEMLQLLVTNHARGTLKCCAIKAPAFGEHRYNLLNDIAIMTGGSVMMSGDKVDTFEKAQKFFDSGIMGTCKKVMIDKQKTTIIGAAGKQELVKERVDSVRSQLNDPTQPGELRGMLQERLGKLASGVAVIRVGGSTETELIERKYRVEDALNATQAAVLEGIVPGGGVALARASTILDTIDKSALTHSEQLGIKLIKDACSEPLRKIVFNAGTASVDVVEKEIKSNPSKTYGYDAANDKFVDVLQAGIIDPVKVTRTALENAASIAGLLLCVNACVIDTVSENV